MGDERRQYPRLSVFGGNAEITEVFGRGHAVGERARILNWSRGGVLLKVSSPRRKLLFLKNDPALFETDSVTCTIRLAPAYNDLEVHGDVVYVAPLKKDPDHLLVGLQFDEEKTAPRSMQEMMKVLEPKSRSGRIKKVSSRQSRVTGRLGAASSESKRPSKRISKRMAAQD